MKRASIRKYAQDFRGAIQDFDQVLALDPQNVEALKNRADSHYRIKNYTESLSDYDMAEIHCDAMDPDISINRAWVHTALEDYGAAIADFTSGLESGSAVDTLQVLRHRGLIYRQTLQHHEALNDFTRAIEIDDNFFDAFRDRADTYISLKRIPEAIEDYSTVIEMDEADVREYEGRGRCYASLGEHLKAIGDFDKALEAVPDRPPTILERAYSHSVLGSNDEAIKDYTRAIELGATDAETYRQRGRCHQLSYDFRSAVQDFGSAIQLDGTEYDDYIQRGLSAEELGNASLAINTYTAAIGLEPDEALAFGLRGGCFDDLENYDLAIEDYLRAVDRDLELKYADLYGYKPIASLYQKQGEYDKAIESYTAAIDQDPNDWESYKLRGVVYGLTEEFELGQGDFMDASEIKGRTEHGLDAAALELPEKIDEYLIKSIAGQGGLSRVYVAVEPKFGRDVAIRIPHEWLGGDETLSARIEREAFLLSRLDHRNIVRVLDMGTYENKPYLVMDYVPERVSAMLRQNGRMPLGLCISIGMQACDALSYLHNLGMIHCDIKPSNILITTNQEVKLTNFMLAKSSSDVRIEGLQLDQDLKAAYGPEESLHLDLQYGHVEGTPGFMPPEQWRGDPLDAGVDIYGLGATLYEMLTGTPFDRWAADVAGISLDNPSLRPPQVHPDSYGSLANQLIPEHFDIPSQLDEIVRTALAPSRSERFQTAIDFRTALEAVGKLPL